LIGGPRDVEGVLIFYGDTSRIIAPDTVVRGETFDVTFSTFAGGCKRRIAYDGVLSAPGFIEIRPYDHIDGGTACTDDLILLTHALLLRVDATGKNVLRIVGQRRDGSSGGNAPVVLTRPIVAR
jgi:hypothetical protein